MPQFTNLLEEALESWKDVRSGVIEEFKNIPADRYDFRATSETRTVRELAIHILEVALMMTAELTREDTNFRRAPWPKLLKMHAAKAYKLKTKTEILAMLRSQLREGAGKFRSAGELHMLQLIERFDGNKGTRMAWLHHAIDQEAHHLGQLTIYTRLIGGEPALTQKIRGSAE